MTNLAPYYVNETLLSARQAEAPQASFRGGANAGASNAMGAGITTDTTLINVKDWTLLDQFGADRTPQNSQHIGETASPIQFGEPTPNGDGYTTLLGTADMPTQSAWEAGGTVFDADSWQTVDSLLGTAGTNWTGIACNDDGSVMIAIGAAGIASRSSDGGVTWTQLPLDLGGTQPTTTNLVSIVCSDGGSRFFVGAADGYSLRTEDGGDTWVNNATGLAGAGTSNITEIAADGYGGVYVFCDGGAGSGSNFSEDYGVTWTEATPIDLNNGSDGADLQVYRVAAASKGTYVFCFLLGACSRTIDNGKTFETLPYALGVGGESGAAARVTGAVSDGLIVVVFYSRFAPDYPYARSVDGGATWAGVPSNYTAQQAFLESVTDSQGNMMQVRGSEPQFSSDYGATWSPWLGSEIGTYACASKTGIFMILSNAATSYRSPA